MKQLPPLTVRDLISKLQQCDLEALVIGTLFNGWTDTYCALDHVSEFTFDQLFNDYFGTPGATDDRVWHTNAKNVVCITSPWLVSLSNPRLQRASRSRQAQ